MPKTHPSQSTTPPDSDADGTHDQEIEQASSKLSEVSNEASAALNRVTGQVEVLARRTVERARQTSGQVREQLGRASEATVGYIKEEPVKAVLIAAVTGATAALVLSWLSRSRKQQRG